MENKATKTMLTFGLILGFASILIELVNYAFGNIYQPHWIISLLKFVVPIVLLSYGIYTFKNANNGYLKIGEAIKIGLGISLISAIIGIFYYLIFTNFLEPNFQENLRAYIENMYMEKFPDMDEAMVENAVNMATKFTKPLFIIPFTIGISLFFGLIISAIAGAIMKNEEHTF